MRVRRGVPSQRVAALAVAPLCLLAACGGATEEDAGSSSESTSTSEGDTAAT